MKMLSFERLVAAIIIAAFAATLVAFTPPSCQGADQVSIPAADALLLHAAQGQVAPAAAPAAKQPEMDLSGLEEVGETARRTWSAALSKALPCIKPVYRESVFSRSRSAAFWQDRETRKKPIQEPVGAAVAVGRGYYVTTSPSWGDVRCGDAAAKRQKEREGVASLFVAGDETPAARFAQAENGREAIAVWNNQLRLVVVAVLESGTQVADTDISGAVLIDSEGQVVGFGLGRVILSPAAAAERLAGKQGSEKDT